MRRLRPAFLSAKRSQSPTVGRRRSPFRDIFCGRLSLFESQVELKYCAPSEELPDAYFSRRSFQIRHTILTQAEAVCQLLRCELEVFSLSYEEHTQLRCSE